MELKELKKKKESDLHKILARSRDKLRDLKFKDASKQLKDVRQIRKIRVTIARVLTLLNEQTTDNRQQTTDNRLTGSEVVAEKEREKDKKSAETNVLKRR